MTPSKISSIRRQSAERPTQTRVTGARLTLNGEGRRGAKPAEHWPEARGEAARGRKRTRPASPVPAGSRAASTERPTRFPGGHRHQHTRRPRSSPRAVHTLVRRTRLLHRMGQHVLPRGSAHPPRPAGAHVRAFEPHHSPRASGGGPAGPTTKDNTCKGSCYPGLPGWGEAGCRGALLCSYVSETFISLLWHLNVQLVTCKLKKHIPMGRGGGGLGRRWLWGP